MDMGLGIVGALAGGLIGGAGILLSSRRKVDAGQALVVHKLSGEPEVYFQDTSVMPLVHRAEIMDISVKAITVRREGRQGLVCRDNIRADIEMVFFMRVNRTKEDVLKVAQSVGCARVSDPEACSALFHAKLSEAISTVGKQIDFEDLFSKRSEVKDRVLAQVGSDLDGFVLEEAAIEHLEQTPIEALDKDNVLDAKGLHKIAEITTERNIRTNALLQQEQKEIARQNLEAAEAILEMERRKADAEIKQKREIAATAAREEAEIQRIASRTRGNGLT